MNKIKLKKAIIICASILFSLIFVGVTVAYITSKTEEENNVVIGDVEVELVAYFEKDGVKYDPTYYKVNLGSSEVVKNGVIKVNISNREDIYFAENFRVDIKVNSDVDTYFRVATYEQLTLVYQTGDIMRELAVVQDGYTDFNYNFYSETNQEGMFFDNRDKDGFIYCMQKVKKVNDEVSEISLIKEYYSDKVFGTRDERYFLQIGFIIEAVQYYEGAQRNWNLERTPWDTEW